MRIVSGKLHDTIAVPGCEISVTVVGIEDRMVKLEISAPPQSVVRQKRKPDERNPDEVAETEPAVTADALDLIAAEITDSAYQAALRCRPTSCWIDLELRLWHSLSSTVKNDLHWQNPTAHQI